jgi:hypothetical protein
MSRAELAITIILRLVGCAAVLATFAVFLPFEWMNAIHRATVEGELPAAPIVNYLARSLSMFYALMGVITLFVARDVRRNASFVTLLGVLYLTSGVVQLGIDLHAPMPLSWTLGEGPFAILIGLVVLALQKHANGERRGESGER